MKPSILVTGDAGYIGSHTTLALLQAGRDVGVQIATRSPVFIRGDIRDADSVFADQRFGAVLHFAGLNRSWL